MSRTPFAAAAVLALLLAACADEPQPATNATTRALLGGVSLQGGPSTEVAPDTSLVGQANLLDIPSLGHNLGSADAPIKLMEFSDYGCGYCRAFHQETFPTLRAQFVDSTRIEWKFIPFITGNFANSLAVTEAAECTREQNPAAFEALSDMLWERQPEWKPSREPESMMRAWAADLGVDVAAYDACLAEDRTMAKIRAQSALAQAIGVRGTPTFWIVGVGPLQGALPLELFQEILSSVYAERMAGTTAN